MASRTMRARSLRFIERARRGEARRRLDQAGEHGGLGQRQLLDRRAEVALAGGLDPIGAGAEVDGIEIPGQDFLFGQPPFEPERQHHLLELARPGALGGEEQVLRQLLRDRAAALDRAAGIEVGERGTNDAAQIQARMLEEPPVLHCQNGVDQMAGDLRQLDRSSPSAPAHGEQDAIGRGQIESNSAGLLEPRGQQQLVRVAERGDQPRSACAEQQQDDENSGPPGFASHAPVNPQRRSREFAARVLGREPSPPFGSRLVSMPGGVDFRYATDATGIGAGVVPRRQIPLDLVRFGPPLVLPACCVGSSCKPA